VFNHNSKVHENIIEIFNKVTDNVQDFEMYKLSKEKLPSLLIKPIKQNSIIVSSSSYALIDNLLKTARYYILFTNNKQEISDSMFLLFQYYLLAAINMFMIHKKYFEQIFQVVDIEETKKKDTLLQTTEFALFINQFFNIRKLFNETKKLLQKLYNINKIDIFDSSQNNEDQSDSNNNIYSKELFLPKINSQLTSFTENNMFSLLVETIILVESIISILKYIKRLLPIEYNIKIKEYKITLTEIRSFLYKPLCGNISRLEPIMQKIQSHKWEMNAEYYIDFSVTSSFILELIDEVIEKKEKLILLSGGSLTDKAINRFLEIFIFFIIEKLQMTISGIQKSNSTGRSLLLNDIKLFKSKIEEQLPSHKPSLELKMSNLILYLNAWYHKEDELIAYIKESKLDYKYALTIIGFGDYFSTLNDSSKRDYIAKVNEIYYNIIIEINDKLIHEIS
jgi:hypothetical protein